MSLITDLLSKVKHEDQKKDIPPGLKDTIIQSAEQRRSRNRMVLPVIFGLLVILAGVAALYYVPSLIKTPAPLAPVAQQSAIPAVTTPALVQPETPVAQEVKQEPPVEPVRTRRGVRRVARSSDATPSTREMRRTSESAPASDTDKTSMPSKRERDEYIYSARSYEAQHDYVRAVASYKRALAADPNNYVLMNNLAGVLIRMENYPEAIRYAGNALNIRKNHVPSLINLGIAYSKMGKSAEGEGYLQQALAADPINRSALLNLGLLYERRNAFDKGSDYYTKLSDRGDIQGYLGLARIAEKQGKQANAINYYRAALSTGHADTGTKKIINDRLMQLTLTP